MNFILYLLLFYIIFRLASWLFVRYIARKARKFTGFSGFADSAEGDYSSETQPKAHKKVFGKEEGDYVDFEELEK